MYELEFLPMAFQDMFDIAHYIGHDLSCPEAAEKLADEMNEAVERLTQFPYLHPVYTPIRPLKNEYRKLVVQKYIMFYYVNESDRRVTIARVIYGGRNYEKLL